MDICHYTELKTDIKRLESKIDKIIEYLEKDIVKNCDKMGEHIDFVETVYETVKHPLDFICSKVNTMMSIENNSSRELEH